MRFSSQSRPDCVRRTSPEILRAGRISGHWLIFQDYRMLRETEGSGIWSMSIRCQVMIKIEYLRTTAKFYHPFEKGNYNVTTTLDDDGWGKRTSMCSEYAASRNREDSRPYTSIDAEKEIGPISKIGIVTVIDVLGIEEVQVPSLSSPEYFVWTLISRGH